MMTKSQSPQHYQCHSHCNQVRNRSKSPPRYQCHFCGRRNHTSTNCRYKNSYLKRIGRNENGQLRKVYEEQNQNQNRPKANNIHVSRPRQEQKEKQVKSIIIIKAPEEKRTSPKRKSPTKKIKQQEHNEEIIIEKEVIKNKIATRPQQNQQSKTHIIKDPYITVQKQNTSNPYLKCKNCLSWEIRLQEQMRIVQTLTEETMRLRREKDSWKNLYELGQSSSRGVGSYSPTKGCMRMRIQQPSIN